MAMNVSSGGAGSEPDVMMDINTTPLIDVMLVLLIMLIITIPIQMHSVQMNLPIGNPPPVAQPQVVQINIDFDGTVTWNGARVSDRADLERHLAHVTAQAEQPEIYLQPSKLAPYSSVAEVLAAAQRKGAAKIGLVSNEQYANSVE